MHLNANVSPFIFSAWTGLGIALIGGFVEYIFTLRRGNSVGSRQLPGCLLFVVGGLAIGAIISIVVSLLLGKGFRYGLILGSGVLSGFYFGFIFMFGLWFLLNR